MNPISWFELPATDMDRAIAFYNVVFDWDLKLMEFGNQQMAWFPMTDKEYGAGGSLVKHESYAPRDNGTLVYFMCEDVAIAIERTRQAGGTVLQEKKQISEDNGYMGLALDTEGNRIAFHSRK